MRTLFLFLLLIFGMFQFPVLASSEPIVVDENTERIEIAGHMKFFIEEPSNNSLTVEDMGLPEVQKLFHQDPLIEKIPTFSSAENKAIWTNFTISNNSSKVLRLYLVYRNSSVEDLTLFTRTASGFSSDSQGTKDPFSYRHFQLPHPVFILDLNPGLNDFYMRQLSRFPLGIRAHLASDVKLSREINWNTFVCQVSLSILVIMAFYNIFIYFFTRQIAYIYYVLALLSVSLYVAIDRFILQSSLFPDWASIYLLVPGSSIAMGLTNVFQCLFTIEFLELRSNKNKKALFVSYGIIALAILTTLATLINNKAFVSIYQVSTLQQWTALFLGLWRYANGYRPAKYFSIAWFFLITGVTLWSMAYIAQVLPESFFPAAAFGNVLECIFLALALGDKIKFEEDIARNKIEQLNFDLKKYIGHVEDIVREKTAKIASIMTNIKQGIFTIKSPQFIVDDDYSTHLETILNEKQIAGRGLAEVFLNKAQMSDDEKSQIVAALSSSIEEPSLAFDINSHLLPKEVMLGGKNSPSHIFEVDWSYIEDENRVIKKILVALKDVTELKKLEGEVKKNEEELTIVTELLGSTRSRISQYLNTSQVMLLENQRLAASLAGQVSAESLKIMFINMHTIKGDARGLSLKKIAGLAHEIEQEYAAVQKCQKEYDPRKAVSDLDRMESLLEKYHEIAHEKLGWTSVEKIELEPDSLLKTWRLISAEFRTDFGFAQPMLEAVKNFFEELLFVPSSVFFTEVFEQLPRIAKDLGKELPVVNITGDQISFDKEASTSLRSAFTHILRNAMDHGIESTAVRQSKGKPSRGHVTLLIVCRPNQDAELHFSDDGKGLDLATIRAKAEGNGIPCDKLNDQEIAELIFHEGFSTTEKVSEISGRGVGMVAVRKFLRDVGGDVAISLGSTAGEASGLPFTLVLTLPSKHFIATHQQLAVAPQKIAR